MAVIYLDATGFQNFQTGVGRYSYNLIAHVLSLRPRWHFVVLVSRRLHESHPVYLLAQDHHNACIQSIRTPVIGPLRDLRFLFPVGAYDIYHCLNSNLPLRLGRGSIVTVHDIIYFHYSQFLGAHHHAKLVYYNALMRHIARRAAGIIAVSRATADDFVAVYTKNEREKQRVRGNMTVIHEGITTLSAAPAATARRTPQHFLYVGELRPHKNIDRIIAGFALFRSQTAHAQAVKLYLVGSQHPSYTLPSPLPPGVEYLGRADDDTLVRLYANAIALCFVSLHEGFGLPILEAMQHRVAVITANRSSMPEVAGDAALLVDPDSVEQIAAAMQRLYISPELRVELIRKGLRNIRRFDWHATAVETCRVYERILNAF